MKKVILFFSLAAASAILFSACKKTDSQTTTTTQKLQAKWTFDQSISDDFQGGVHTRDTITAAMSPGYLDFRTDNKVYSLLVSISDTSNYQVLGDTKIVTWSTADPLTKDTSDIQTLTSSQLILHSKQVDAADYSESTIYFKK